MKIAVRDYQFTGRSREGGSEWEGGRENERERERERERGRENGREGEEAGEREKDSMCDRARWRREKKEIGKDIEAQ